jgi:hypothetical protein
LGLKYFEKGTRASFYNCTERIFISRPAEPTDIHWKNLSINLKEKYIRIALAMLVIIGVIVGCAELIDLVLEKK